jgi:uncharacterized protein YutE (UPF0331/DUF86 family)
MDRLIVERKLESLRRCLARVRSKLPVDPVRLRSDYDLQDVLVLNLSRAVQQSFDLALHLQAGAATPPPETMGQAFDRLAEAGLLEPALALRLRRAVGFRNVVVHAYQAINWDIVEAILAHHLDDFSAFARRVADAFDLSH